RTRTLVVLRHAQARARGGWHSDDRFRPLLVSGEQQAQRLAPVLAAHDVQTRVSSSSTRCVTTLLPYADLTHRRIHTAEALTEEGATAERVRRAVRELLDQKRPTVLCSHRPVLPVVFEALGLADPGLETGE